MRTLVAYGRKEPRYPTLHITYRFSEMSVNKVWDPIPQLVERDEDEIRKIKLESSED